MTDLSNAEKIARIQGWQRAGHVPPLTCNEESCRSIFLEPIEHGGRVILVCPRCGSKDEQIPRAVLGPLPPGPGSAR